MKRTISRKGSLTVMLLALVALWSGTVRAGGDYDAGARKSIYCAYCHGYDGNPGDASVPRLAGRAAEQLIARIQELEATGSMHQAMLKAFLTGSLGEADVADLAAFYARQQAAVGAEYETARAAGE